MRKGKSVVLLVGAAVIAALSSGCRGAGGTSPPTATTSPSGVNPPAGSVQAIAAEEPDSYSATLRLSAESPGASPLPNLEAEVARRGRDRRVRLRLPDGDEVVYLSRGGARYVLLPDRELYAEVDSREASFELPRPLTPDGLVDYLKEQGGYVRAGEEELNGRTVVKYVASVAGRAGSVVYVDKLTGLPLRAELVSEFAGGVKVVAEMSNIRTGADRNLFTVPRGMKKVKFEQVLGQVNSRVGTAAGVAGVVQNQTSAAAADTSASAGHRMALP